MASNDNSSEWHILTSDGVRKARHEHAVSASHASIVPLRDSYRFPDGIAVLSPYLMKHLAEATLDAAEQALKQDDAVTVLVPRRELPLIGFREDREQVSLICTGTIAAWLKQEMATARQCCTHLSYKVLDAVMNGLVKPSTVVVCQLPRAHQVVHTAVRQEVDVVMAHRGSRTHLDACLSSLQLSGLEPGQIYVGFDDARTSQYDSLLAANQGVNFFEATGSRSGPYPIRQQLVESCNAATIAFQDSDDYSCTDRFAVQLAALREFDCDLVGCHELRIDEATKQVSVVRFPSDVNEALGTQIGEPLLHATIVARREKWLALGGFTTDHLIASDTQFMLRAFFSLQMRNVDEVCYLRRGHASALTVHQATKFGSELRESLRLKWEEAFLAVREGVVPLDESELQACRSRSYPRLGSVPQIGLRISKY